MPGQQHPPQHGLCSLHPDNKLTWSLSFAAGGNQDGKFSVGFRDGVVRTVVSLDRETVASYTLILEAIGKEFPLFLWDRCHAATQGGCACTELPWNCSRETATFEVLYKPEPVFGVTVSQPMSINMSQFHHDFYRQ